MPGPRRPTARWASASRSWADPEESTPTKGDPTTREPDHPTADAANDLGDPLIAEDLLLVLFSPDSGTIAGEGALFYVLAGALLTELALNEQILIDHRGALRGTEVTAAGEHPPADPLLSQAWEYAAKKPTGAQTLLAAVGPGLREPLLDRLVRRGDIEREKGKVLGLIPRTRLRSGANSRRPALIAQIRSVLLDGEDPEPRTGAIIALLSASDSLPTLHREIPWSGSLYHRTRELENGDWGARAAGAAVARTAAAVVSNALVAVNVTPRS